ncbi:hypothetical protein D4764_01G0007180 [Takifugu flavidus]|uniref:Immunoglobulin domain-containing protein n=1 Tax=Takifugu flavidus TaxID=433684 RepID=A0A5C6PN95_9TELE|nr:hypothetical protein D4764_01G0007180 [Takifugu flavidus]
MAPRVFQAFFLNVIFCLVAAQSIKYGLKGQEVKLKPQIQEQQPDQILWMHGDNKVIEFNGKEEDVYGPFKNRTTLDWHSAELHLTDLRSEDSGLYELELYMQKKSYFYYYTLQVIAPQPDIEYEWFFYGNTQPGPQLRIFLDNKHDERVYSCRVSNPLSNRTAEFTAKDCYSDESSPVVLAAVLPAVVLLVLVVLVVAGVKVKVRYKMRHQNRVASDVSEACLSDLVLNRLQPTATETTEISPLNHNRRGLVRVRKEVMKMMKVMKVQDWSLRWSQMNQIQLRRRHLIWNLPLNKQKVKVRYKMRHQNRVASDVSETSLSDLVLNRLQPTATETTEISALNHNRRGLVRVRKEVMKVMKVMRHRRRKTKSSLFIQLVKTEKSAQLRSSKNRTQVLQKLINQLTTVLEKLINQLTTVLEKLINQLTTVLEKLINQLTKVLEKLIHQTFR